MNSIRSITCIFLFFLSSYTISYAQNIQVIRFVPANYLSDNGHQVVLYNFSPIDANISGYLIVTRDYSVRIPDNTIIKTKESYKIAKKKTNIFDANLELTTTQDFIIRRYSKKVEGNYIVIINRGGQVIDAFYNSQLTNVPFLPDSGVCIMKNLREIPYKIPPENIPVWQHYPVGDDPAIGFEKIDGKWRVTSAIPTVNVYPTTRFENFKGQYNNGVAVLKWETAFEENLTYILLEKSEDQQVFTIIQSIIALKRNSKDYTSYVYYDDQIKQGKTYFYRLRNIDARGYVISSKIIEIVAQEIQIPFWIELFPTETNESLDITLRFFTAFSQNIRIQLLDSTYNEIAILHNEYVYAETQNLLKITRNLAIGKYFIVVATESKRYWNSFTITN